MSEASERAQRRADSAERARDRGRLAAWRRANPCDANWVMSRLAEAA